MAEGAEILEAIRKLEARIKRQSRNSKRLHFNTLEGFPDKDVVNAAVAATQNLATLHRNVEPIAVIGSLSHFSGSVYSKIAYWLGLEPCAPGDAPDSTRIALVWEPSQRYSRNREREIASLKERCKNIQVLNHTNFDSDKKNVQECFKTAFGYNLEVDPRRHVGPAVTKSRKNATHDGKVVSCPVSDPSKDHVYEVVVNNEVPGDLVEDLRIPIVNFRPVLSYMKYRPLSTRFSNGNTYARVAGIFDVMSFKEALKVEKFCRVIGLEVGEIDVLRDRGTRKLYIVDANNTPHGPPNGIELRDADLAVRWLADSVVRSYLSEEDD